MARTDNWIEAGKANFAAANARRSAEAAARREAEYAVKERQRLLRKLRKLMRQHATALRLEAQEASKSQHGVAIGDYYRCKKANGTACDPCKSIAAEYMRDRKAADPDLYRRQKRAYYAKYPHKKTEANRRKERRERARLRQVDREPYDTQDILDLWGTDCHICNEPVDLEATRHCGEDGWERGLHLDHVIPLAKGGSDTPSNVKPSHAKCNMDKSDSLL